MAERFCALPAWMTRQQQTYASAAEAAVAASDLVAHDGVPRAVIKVESEVSMAARPAVAIVQIAEVGS